MRKPRSGQRARKSNDTVISFYFAAMSLEAVPSNTILEKIKIVREEKIPSQKYEETVHKFFK